MSIRNLEDYAFYDIAGPLAIAHRGGDSAGPEKENSMVAFEAAQNCGLIYIETDTVATSDGIPLALHGARSRKQEAETGLPYRSTIESMTLKEIEDTIRVGGEKIPTLEEVLTTFPNLRFFIDPKTRKSERPLAKLINKLGAQERVSVGGFQYAGTKRVAEMVEGGQERLATCLSILGFLSMQGLRLDITVPIVRPYFTESRATSLQVPHKLNGVETTQTMVERAQELGFKVIFWASNPEINDNADYINNSLNIGVDGVMSDHNKLLKDIILSRDPNNMSIRQA